MSLFGISNQMLAGIALMVATAQATFSAPSPRNIFRQKLLAAAILDGR
jgi:carbon starvation protein CstA